MNVTYLKFLFVILLTTLSAHLAHAEKASVISQNCLADISLASEDRNQSIAQNKLTQIVIKIAKMAGESVTGLRKEAKFTVLSPVADNLIEFLQNNFKDQFQFRDKLTKGNKNITLTSYLKPIEFVINGKTRTAKVRFRKYYSIPEATDVARMVMDGVPSEAFDFLKDKQFVELKVEHEDLENTVYKPRFLMNDADVALIRSTGFYAKYRRAIYDRTIKINRPEDQPLIREFFKAFDLLAATDDLKFNSDLTTAYVRMAFSLKLKDKDGKNLEVQFTLDHEIAQRLEDSQFLQDTYEPEHVVAEIKIPVVYANLTPADLANVPGLDMIASLISQLQKEHDPRFIMNRGKRSHALRANMRAAY